MELHPMFTVGFGYSDQKAMLPIARKIFAENQELLIGADGIKTNFCAQNPNKSLINNNYKYPEDIDSLKKVILEEAIIFLEQSGLYASEYDYEVTNLWLNQMEDGGDQVRHSHYGYIVSGCFYVDMPKECNDIVFFNPSKHIIPVVSTPNFKPTIYNGVEYGVSPEEGNMFFWFSTLDHSVPFKKYSGIRRCIPFDITIKKIK